jgi:hypothetical protein
MAKPSKNPGSLVNLSGVAKILGVSRQRASEMKALGKLPAPHDEVAGRPVWTVASVERFHDERKVEKTPVKKTAKKGSAQ